MKDIIYKKILVTHDGSKLSEAAIPHVGYLARMLQTKVILLRVIESVSQEFTYITPGVIPPVPIIAETAVETVKEDRKLAQEQLERVKSKLEEKEIHQVETRVEEGDPGKQIIYVAKENHVDLIIISTHGRSGLKRAFLGSVADYVIRYSQCPVLVVRPNQEVKV